MKKVFLLSIIFITIGTAAFSQQTDPTLTAAVLGQTAAMTDIHKKRKQIQEKILVAETAVTVALDRVHNVEDKMLSYLSNASAAVQNLHEIKRCAELVGKEIPKNCEFLAQCVKGNLKGTAIAAIASDEITGVYSEMAALAPFMYQLVTSGTYNSYNTETGQTEPHKVNLLNAAERYYIANEVVSRLERINTKIFILGWQVSTMTWRNLWYSLDPKGWATVMSGANRVDFIIQMWKRL